MKKLRFHLSILIALFVFGTIHTSQGQTIRGTVVDATTGFPLPGAHVILLNSNPLQAVSTDENGLFLLTNVSLGRQSLEVTYLGYQKRVVNNLLLSSGRETPVDIQLEELAFSVDEVVVRARSRKEEAINELATVSARTFSVEETERYAGSLGDPARMVANFAGVMTQNDSRNDIIIRGNSPSGVLWRLEGIEIPNPNHFGALGTTGGPVSMVNNNLLRNSDFLTGAFPAEFGNALAGVFDINLRSGNTRKHEFVGQVGFNGFELGAEGPLLKTGNGQISSYLVNYRYSTLEVMNKLGFNVGTGVAIPQYKDLTFLVDVPGTKAGRFKIYGLFGDSFIDLGRNLTDTVENQYNARGMATDFGSGLSVTGLTHTYFFNDRTRIKNTISWQRTNSTAVLDSIKNDFFVPFLREKQEETKLSFSTQFLRKMSSRDNFSAGLIVDRYSVNSLDSIFSYEYNRFLTRTNIDGNLMLYRSYAQWQHRFGNRLTGYSGLHVLYFNLTDEVSLEPRLGLRWQFSDRNSFTAGLGMHSQVQPKTVYFYQNYDPDTDSYARTNELLGLTKSNHFVIGHQYLLNSHFRIKTETYYQHLYNVPVKEGFSEFSLLNSGDQFGIPREDSLVNKGLGRNYGVELTVERFLSKGWYVLFTASLFDSKYTGSDKVWRNTAFNGNYVFNLLGGYEVKIGANTMLTLDMKTVWAGGKRFIPVDLQVSLQQREEVRDWSKAYQNRYDDYFRTDLRMGIKINHRKYNQEFGIDFQNVGAYRSVFMESYDVANEELYKINQQGFLPMFLYRIQF